MCAAPIAGTPRDSKSPDPTRSIRAIGKAVQHIRVAENGVRTQECRWCAIIANHAPQHPTVAHIAPTVTPLAYPASMPRNKVSNGTAPASALASAGSKGAWRTAGEDQSAVPTNFPSSTVSAAISSAVSELLIAAPVTEVSSVMARSTRRFPLTVNLTGLMR